MEGGNNGQCQRHGMHEILSPIKNGFIQAEEIAYADKSRPLQG